MASPEIDRRLKDCKKQLTFTWGSSDPFELRMAFLSSAILTQLTNGVCSYPGDNQALWHDHPNFVEQAFREVQDFEKSLKEKHWHVHSFRKWRKRVT